MASLLLDADEGAFVSMELIDDVGVKNKDGQILASQTKSVRKTNPVSDHSPALWKTFSNWTREVRSGHLDPTKTIFELYVNRKVSGGLATDFHNAKTKHEALIAFERAREQLWGKSPKFPLRKNISGTLKTFIDEVFDSGADAFVSILPKFQLTCAKTTPAMDLHNQIAKWLIIDEVIRIDIICHIHGWLKTMVDSQLETGKAPVISRDDFVHELKTYYGRRVPQKALPDLATKPTPTEIFGLMSLFFVKQLTLIGVDSDTRNHAMTCFFKAASTRTKWADGALVHDDSLIEFEELLLQAHRNYKTEIYSDPQRTDKQLQGQLLLGRCDQYRCKLEQKDVPEYFVPGCFHSLADKKTIGWHSEYKTLLGIPDV